MSYQNETKIVHYKLNKDAAC